MSSATHRYRIAMVAACPFPSLRGSQVLIRELAEALVARGHEVHVVTYPSGEHVVPINGISIHRVPSIAGLSGSRSWWAKIVLDLALLVVLHRVVRRYQIEVVHAHNYEAPVLGYAVRWLRGVPVVYHSHNAMHDELPHYFRSRWGRSATRCIGSWLDATIPRRADCCIALTTELADYLRRQRVPAARIAVIPPAVAPQPVEASETRTLLAGREVVLYAGNLDPYQRVDLLLSAFGRVRQLRPEAVLVLAVHPARSRGVQRRLAKIRRLPSVRVVEARSFGAIRSLLSRADVVVCPRTSWSGFPIKVLNFMSFGRAIVACASAAKVLRHNETGVIVSDDDANAMASAIVALLEDPARRAALGAAAQESVNGDHSWEIVLPRIEAVYSGLGGLVAAAEGFRGSSNSRELGLIVASRGSMGC